MPLRSVEPDRVPSGHWPPAIQQQSVPFDEAIPKVAGVLSVVLQPLVWLPLEGLVVELVGHHRRQRGLNSLMDRKPGAVFVDMDDLPMSNVAANATLLALSAPCKPPVVFDRTSR